MADPIGMSLVTKLTRAYLLPAVDVRDQLLPPRCGPWLHQIVPPELDWSNAWWWLTPHDWERDCDCACHE